MQGTYRVLLAGLIVFAAGRARAAGPVAVFMENTSKVDREAAVAVVAVDALGFPDRPLQPGHFELTNPREMIKMLIQVDDLNGDGAADEVALLTRLKAGERVVPRLSFAEDGKAWPQQGRLTIATTLPGWESEQAGFRSYGAFALDPFARRRDQPGLYLADFFDGRNRQIYNYHRPSDRGMDILHVGPTAGLAGLVLVNGDRILLPLSGAIEAEVLASGPVRSIVRMTKPDWTNELGVFRFERTATIHARCDYTEVEDRVEAVRLHAAEVGVGLGMKDVEGMKRLHTRAGRLTLQWHRQDDDIGDVGMGLLTALEPARTVRDDLQEALVLGALTESGSVVTQRSTVFAAWRKGGACSSWEQFQQQAHSLADMLASPVRVRVHR